jgi:hypothetical protein
MRRNAAARPPEWAAVREPIELAAVATALLGPPPSRRGSRSGGRLGWNCRFHDDPNPDDTDPRRFTREAQSAQRWGPAIGDQTAAIVNDRPDPARMLAAPRVSAASPDEADLAERTAIRVEGDEPIYESRSGGTEEGGQR